ncbi:MAG: hypothetical protein JWQ07_4912 [Ramlibacter sp.]|nr:hypothetical protein [Ramlibacter sp.]
MKTLPLPSIAFAALATLSASAVAHVSFEEPRAEIGRPYTAVLRVGHGCDAAATTAVAVQVPAAFGGVKPVARPGWNLVMRDGVATWTAQSKETALPSTERGEFILAGTAPRTAGPLWFKVLQTCEQGSLNWSEAPAQGTSTAGLKTPAVLLEVMSARDFALARALPKVEGAWVRSSVAGQQGTGAYMRLTAPETMQLVGVATPAAGAADVHEMKMDGDVMKMRPIGKLDLPAGQAVELKPGGYHIMLQDLKQPLAKDSTVALTLFFRNAQGAQAHLELKLPVALQAPGAAAVPTDGHKH